MSSLSGIEDLNMASYWLKTTEQPTITTTPCQGRPPMPVGAGLRRWSVELWFIKKIP
jgi:hypothetical protein